MKLFTMKKTRFIALVLLLLGSVSAKAQDTVKVDVGGTKVIIITKDKDGLKDLSKVDLNKIIAEAVKKADSSRSGSEKTVIVYQPNENFNDYYTSEYENQRNRHRRYKRRRRSRVRNYLSLDLGFNNYLENGRFPDEAGKEYGLDVFGSRYISVGWYRRTSLFGSPLRLTMGVEVSWNNFMFTNDTYITQDSAGVNFRDYLEDNNVTIDKSKLTTIYANVPILLGLRFQNPFGRTAFRFDIGGYFGYRLDSYAKIKPSGQNVQRPHRSYFLNNWRYGLVTYLGFDGFQLFAKYDLNPLFVEGKGPSLNAFSFGIRL